MGQVHFLRWHNYYACNRAVGNGVRGLATKNKTLVTCFNCIWSLKKNSSPNAREFRRYRANEFNRVVRLKEVSDNVAYNLIVGLLKKTKAAQERKEFNLSFVQDKLALPLEQICRVVDELAAEGKIGEVK